MLKANNKGLDKMLYEVLLEHKMIVDNTKIRTYFRRKLSNRMLEFTDKYETDRGWVATSELYGLYSEDLKKLLIVNTSSS